jgi:PAS domain S-box-containing protein
MESKFGEILAKIAKLSDCDSAYVLKSSGKTLEVISTFGQINFKQKSFSDFNRNIAVKNSSQAELLKSVLFSSLKKELKYIDLLKVEFSLEDSVSYFFILLSKKKFKNVRQLRERISKILTSLKAMNQPSEVSNRIELDQIYREALSTVPTVLFSTNADGSHYNFITDAVRNLLGYSPQEVYENKLLILRSIDEEHFHKFRSFVDKLRTGEVATVEYKMKDRFGKEHWVRHSGIPIIRNNEVVRVVGMINEITDEKLIQLKLSSSEERFRMLIDTADDLIFILNGFGYFSLVNKNGATALGYVPDEMIGKHFLEFIAKEDETKIAEAFSKILSSNEVTTFEAAFLDRFDKGVTFEVHAKPMYSDGEVSGMISIGRNITQRKFDEQKIRDLNAKLIEANRIISIERERARHKINVLEELNKLKGEFISNISHELRTPLASIVGFAETILSDPDLPKDTAKEFNEIILSEGKRLAKLINDVLDFSKLESGEEELHSENINLVSVLDETLNLFAKQFTDKELYVSKDLPASEMIIKADRARIAQVFYNLLSNSIKFTNKGGRISIIIVDYGKEIEIAFSDTGIGIPEKDIPKLFQKFSKIARPGAPLIGAGFGLATVKQIVELHKGVVRVKSEENKGSTFLVRLPKQ